MIIYKSLPDKYCHQALDLGRIRLGSLFYYREIEDGNRKDSSEGPIPFHIFEQELDADRFNNLAAGTPFRLKSPWKIKIEGAGRLIIQNEFNTFVYCCSWSKDKAVPNPKFGNSAYKIKDASR